MANTICGRRPNMGNFKMLLMEILKESNFQNEEKKAKLPSAITLSQKHHISDRVGRFVFQVLKEEEIIRIHRDGMYSVTNKRDDYTNKPFSIGDSEKVQMIYDRCRELSPKQTPAKKAKASSVETAPVKTVDNPIVETVEKPTFTTEELVAMLEEKGYEVSLKHIYKLV